MLHSPGFRRCQRSPIGRSVDKIMLIDRAESPTIVQRSVAWQYNHTVGMRMPIADEHELMRLTYASLPCGTQRANPIRDHCIHVISLVVVVLRVLKIRSLRSISDPVARTCKQASVRVRMSVESISRRLGLSFFFSPGARRQSLPPSLSPLDSLRAAHRSGCPIPMGDPPGYTPAQDEITRHRHGEDGSAGRTV
jgi:hypothetical protein